MHRLWLFVLTLLIVSGHCDVEPNYYILPVKIHYQDKQIKTGWVGYSVNRFYSSRHESNNGKRPVPGKKVLFLNKLDTDDSLTISPEKYTLPDNYSFFIAKRISLREIELIEDISSDSLQVFSGWSDVWMEPEIGDLLLNHKPVFIDLIVLEQEACYNAEHVYCFDSSMTKETVRKLYKSGGRQNKVLNKAIQEKRIVFIKEVTP